MAGVGRYPEKHLAVAMLKMSPQPPPSLGILQEIATIFSWSGNGDCMRTMPCRCRVLIDLVRNDDKDYRLIRSIFLQLHLLCIGVSCDGILRYRNMGEGAGVIRTQARFVIASCPRRQALSSYDVTKCSNIRCNLSINEYSIAFYFLEEDQERDLGQGAREGGREKGGGRVKGSAGCSQNPTTTPESTV